MGTALEAATKKHTDAAAAMDAADKALADNKDDSKKAALKKTADDAKKATDDAKTALEAAAKASKDADAALAKLPAQEEASGNGLYYGLAGAALVGGIGFFVWKKNKDSENEGGYRECV